MNKLNQATLFWLDGHYSASTTARGDKDTPIYEELRHIFEAPAKGHVIIIDDARCFGKIPSYPTQNELIEFVKSKSPKSNISIQGDFIRITPG